MTTPSELTSTALMNMCDEAIEANAQIGGYERQGSWIGHAAVLAHALKERLEADRWLPIEQAPKTGDDLIEKCVLGYCSEEEHPNDRFKVVWWEPKIKGGVWWSDQDIECKPTHFRPLPSPPADGQKGEGR